MLVVNLYGGPGCGKSTGAAYIFARLKEQGVKAELVTEFAKDLTYDRSDALKDQTYVFAGQLHKLVRCMRGGVRVAITDSPLLLSLLYRQEGPLWGDAFAAYVQSANDCFDNLNVMVNRYKPYVEYGRSESEAEARHIDERVRRELPVTFDLTVDGHTIGYEHVVDVARLRSRDNV